MIVKCQSCGHENQLGAIFCRACGEKLDLEKIRPDKIVSKEKKKKRVFFRIMGLVIFVVFLVEIFILFKLFVPSGNFHSVNPSVKSRELLWSKNKLLEKSRGRRFQFSVEEVSLIFNDIYNFEKVPISITTLKSGQLLLLRKVLVGGLFNVEFAITGKFENPDKSNKIKHVIFKILDVKVGNISLPQDLFGIVTSRFIPLMSDQRIQKLYKRIKKIEVDNYDIIIYV